MKLISSLHGRALQGFDADEVRASKSIYLPEVVDLIRQRYGFVRQSDIRTANESGMKFEEGRLPTVDGSSGIAIENLDFYSDGIVATGRDTEDAEQILDDAIEWAIKTFGLRRPENWLLRTFTSWLVVEFEEPIASMFANFSSIQRLIVDAHQSAHGKKLDFQLQRITFNVDPKTVPQFAPTEYTIDRRGGASYSSNRFFCMAPLRTEKHVELLQQMDDLIRK